MAIKPTGYPEWASSTPTGITEPSSGKKQSGWGVNEKPAAQYMNWLEEKQSSWVKYLSYEWLIHDEFVRDPVLQTVTPSGKSSTGLTNFLTNFWAYCIEANFAETDAAGLLELNFNASGIGYAEIQPARISSDVLFEAKVRYNSARGASGHNALFGMRDQSGGNTGAMWFSAHGSSGASGPWFFNWWPITGTTPTSFNTGVYPKNSINKWDVLSFERRGPTAYVEINGQSLMAAAVPTLISQAAIGVYVNHSSGSADIYVDYMKFGVRR